ncbi:MAG: amino acid acetyltransferase [Bdellovibrio sp.]|nr:MAG: amino acid acetyltransferase [Bdellovibrio sp.]
MSPGPGLHRTVLPKSFFASGANCGVRRYRPDLGIITSEKEAVTVATYTTNECQAAPLIYCRELLPSRRIRAVVTNSGQANAATGELGLQRNFAMAEAAARSLGVETSQVLTASTGVIGHQIEIDKIVQAMPELIARSTNVAENFALSILTTDLVPKAVTTVVRLSQGEVRITGICKGSGMIHPNMATMLGYLLTDLQIEPELAQSLLREAVDQSFNMISVDGDCSTNDITFFMANGASGVALKDEEDYCKFKDALFEVARFLAQAIAADGEGATKLIEVTIRGAPDLELARRAARGVTLSPLIKSAIHGANPNWGRILARLGAEKVPASCLQKTVISLQSVAVFADGSPLEFDRRCLHDQLKQSKVQIDIDLASGKEEAVAWGCDLSKQYIDINTEYS